MEIRNVASATSLRTKVTDEIKMTKAHKITKTSTKMKTKNKRLEYSIS